MIYTVKCHPIHARMILIMFGIMSSKYNIWNYEEPAGTCAVKATYKHLAFVVLGPHLPWQKVSRLEVQSKI